MERLAQGRDQETWNELMAPALSGLKCRVIPSTSDEAPGLLADVEHHLGAHHSPDLFHVQPELSQAVCAPMASKERAAHQAVTKAEERGLSGFKSDALTRATSRKSGVPDAHQRKRQAWSR